MHESTRQSPLSSHSLGSYLANRRRREEVLEVEVAVVLVGEVVRAQRRTRGAQRRDRKCLRLAAREQRAAVRPGEDTCSRDTLG